MKKVKAKLVLKHKVKVLLNKFLLMIILLLVGMIIVKQNPNLKLTLEKNIYEKNIKFTSFKKIYEKYFGNLLSADKILKETTPVFNEKLTYDKLENYEDGIKLKVSNNYLIPTLESGIIVFIGEKKNFGSTVIIEQIDGIDTYYSNINTNNIKLYDYVEKGELLGETIDDKLYLKFEKNGKSIDYKKYF